MEAVDEELRPVDRRTRRRGVREDEREWNVVVGRDIEIELGRVECDSGLSRRVRRIRRCGEWRSRCSPGKRLLSSIESAGKVKTQTLDVQRTLIERAARNVLVVLAAKVSSDLPLDVRLLVAGKRVVEDTAGVLHGLGADGPVLVEAHVIDDDGDDVGLALDEGLGERVGAVADDGGVEARPAAEEGRVQERRVSEGGPALCAEVERGLVACGGEVAAEDEAAGVEAVVCAVQRGGRLAGLERVRGFGDVGGGPGGVGVGVGDLGEGVDGVPFDRGEGGEGKFGGSVGEGCL